MFLNVGKFTLLCSSLYNSVFILIVVKRGCYCAFKWTDIEFLFVCSFVLCSSKNRILIRSSHKLLQKKKKNGFYKMSESDHELQFSNNLCTPNRAKNFRWIYKRPGNADFLRACVCCQLTVNYHARARHSWFAFTDIH